MTGPYPSGWNVGLPDAVAGVDPDFSEDHLDPVEINDLPMTPELADSYADMVAQFQEDQARE